MPIFLLYGRKNVNTLWKHISGIIVWLKRQRIAVENNEGYSSSRTSMTELLSNFFVSLLFQFFYISMSEIVVDDFLDFI
jgi:hypothetical protein